MEHFPIGLISMLVGLAGFVASMFNKVKADSTVMEKRLTVMEKELEYLKQFQLTATKRLDDHEQQNKSLIILTEKIKTLSDDVKELRKSIDEKRRNDDD